MEKSKTKVVNLTEYKEKKNKENNGLDRKELLELIKKVIISK